jgi:hypothetical protein
MSSNSKLLDTLDDLYSFKEFAVGGISKFGSTRKQSRAKPRRVPDGKLKSLMDMCQVKVGLFPVDKVAV